MHYHNSQPRYKSGKALFSVTDSRIRCVAWRQTGICSPFGPRDPLRDRLCQAKISSGSGYCQCSGGLTVKRVACGFRGSFTCEQECDQLNNNMEGALQLPRNITCPSTGLPARHVAAHLQGKVHGSKRRLISNNEKQRQLISEDAEAAEGLWRKIQVALVTAGHNRVVLPERRTGARDWVKEGLRMPKRDTDRAQQQWQLFMATAPSYPEGMFRGKGITILAGGGQYMVPAWVNIHMLRRTGCMLPVEMFFPAPEYPTVEMEAALAALGVKCRALPSLTPGDAYGMETVTYVAGHRIEAHLAGFKMKIGALLLSSFKEVIFLDSDNVAVADPTSLLQSEEFRETGVLLWPDYWKSTAAPDLATILNVTSLPPGSFESGQMLFDKQRTWDALLLAAFFNMESDLYYELFSGWMGKGDKESFAHALSATDTPYHLVPTPVGSVGLIGLACGEGRKCKHRYKGNTMTQHDMHGNMMFLHTNLSPKWSLQLPGDFSMYSRRWQAVEPGGLTFAEAYPELGDVEREIYTMLVDLCCAPFLQSYRKALSSEERMGANKMMPVGLAANSFHTINGGVDFYDAYKLGMRGSFEAFTPLPLHRKAGLRLKRFYQTLWALIRRGVRRKPRYFVLW
ncbi:hypothetical protein WJX73_001325 [Symbiochloris irregularis]|uniref:Nucleotide-diphospho-sugar transferase n=1 Tax=Symbiochloris irregularis TaxID=706552 RepID=A0AAW1NTP2_9CHLO